MFVILSAPPDQPQSSRTMGNVTKSSKNDAVISAPVSTLPHNVSGPLLSEKFKPEEPQSDVYSLATAAIYDVQTNLGRGAEVPSGTSLSDALTAKGMGVSPINPTYSQSTHLPEGAYFSPRSADPSSLYAVPQKKSKIPKQQSVETGIDKQVSPKHRPLSGTQSDAVLMRLSSEERAQQQQQPSTPASAGYRPAETMSNGYMRPSQWVSRPRPANYDYVIGPPRPADGSAPPHHSPLLRRDNVQQPADQEEKDSHTYINMRELHNEIEQIEAAPKIDRSTKPPNPVPPRVDRGLKPGTRKAQSEDDDLSSSPPNFPTRTGSLSTPPIIDASDLPKPTRRTMKYTQVQFDSTGQLTVLDDPAPSTTPGDINQRAPVPIPRGQNKPKRVNYSEIDLTATQAMATSSSSSSMGERHMSLNEAEVAALAEKPYVNVARDGLPDDDTDPDYYTHMRVSHTHTHTHTHTHAHTHTHTHTHTHSHTPTHTHASWNSRPN